MAKNSPHNIFFPKELHQVFNALRFRSRAILVAGGTSFHGYPSSNCLNKLEIDNEDIINLLDIPELKKVRATDYGLDIGSVVSLAQISQISPKRLPLLLNVALKKLLQYPIFFQATIGGNLCLKPWAGDLSMVLGVLGAQYELKSPSGTRWLDSARLLDSYALPINPNEVLTRVKLPETSFNEAFFYSDFHAQYPQNPSRLVLTARVSQNILEDLRLAIQLPGLPTVTHRSIEENLLGKRLPFSKRDISSVLSNIKSRYSAYSEQASGQVAKILLILLDYFRRINMTDYNPW